MSIEDLVVEFYRKGIFMTGEFKLSSGKISPYYIDLRKALAYPDLYTAIAVGLVDKLHHSGLDFTAIVGVATGGIPYATLVAALLLKPLGYVRVERKEHGTRSIIEGACKGHKVVIVDDVTTTGTNLMRAAEVVEESGGEVVGFLVVVDRKEGAKEALESKFKRPLLSLLTVPDMLSTLRGRGLLSESEYERILNYIRRARSK